MKIKRISENLVQEISEDKISEMELSLKEISKLLDEKKSEIEKLISTISEFTSKNKSKNDQLDDSKLNLDKAKTSMLDTMVFLDTVTKNLEDYKTNGRKYLY